MSKVCAIELEYSTLYNDSSKLEPKAKSTEGHKSLHGVVCLSPQWIEMNLGLANLLANVELFLLKSFKKKFPKAPGVGSQRRKFLAQKASVLTLQKTALYARVDLLC